ncbi:MAG: SPOR domain-containing protein [Bacteroidota bacterium]
MRTHRLIILLILAACKAATPSSSGRYHEDLSVHRFPYTIENNEAEKTAYSVQAEKYTPLTGHIGTELDSIAKIAYQQNIEGRYVDGYTIQVYSGANRNDANEAESKMTEFFPDLDAKVTYRQPNFRVRGGQFIDRLEANRVYNEVKREFPRALLIPERLLISYE